MVYTTKPNILTTSQTDNTSSISLSSTESLALMTAIFTDLDAAETAYDALLSHGFSKDDFGNPKLFHL
ncbi:hypothetical protein HMF3257_31200 [Spirosoma telluris]|uniref:Uncharacterized protein n=1 Tax=Spirosoma telluris TaxID=2183553 RepID=A0A327NU48_9BACT|nr:hypothetical protein HMF3257_31200 [Spirosoma telluris]